MKLLRCFSLMLEKVTVLLVYVYDDGKVLKDSALLHYNS